MTKLSLRLFIVPAALFLFSNCVQKVVHEHKSTNVPQTPFKAVAKSSQCYTDRSVYDGTSLKEEFVESTAVRLAQQHGQTSYEKSIRDCVTANGTGRQIIVYMCSPGTFIKDHYCHYE